MVIECMHVIPISIAVFARHITDLSVELWMQRRSESGPLDGLLEFPGGKIEPNEDSVTAASREVLEEVGLEVAPSKLKLFKIYTHDYEDRSVCLFTHLIIDHNFNEDRGWVEVLFDKPLEILENQVPAANKEIIVDICAYIRELKTNKTLEQLWGV
jgi:mutator protein MutT